MTAFSLALDFHIETQLESIQFSSSNISSVFEDNLSSWPLLSLSFVIVSDSTELATDDYCDRESRLLKFLRWIVHFSQPQGLLEGNDYIPLTTQQEQQVVLRMEQIACNGEFILLGKTRGSHSRPNVILEQQIPLHVGVGFVFMLFLGALGVVARFDSFFFSSSESNHSL